MAELTTDPNDPRLGRGVDKEKTEQHSAYLVLSDEEKAKGFVRPVRTGYVHLTTEDGLPTSNAVLLSSVKLKGCGTLTTMSQSIAETYARDPKFYGATYCVGCQKHLDVSEFTWDGCEELVGS